MNEEDWKSIKKQASPGDSIEVVYMDGGALQIKSYVVKAIMNKGLFTKENKFINIEEIDDITVTKKYDVFEI